MQGKVNDRPALSIKDIGAVQLLWMIVCWDAHPLIEYEALYHEAMSYCKLLKGHALAFDLAHAILRDLIHCWVFIDVAFGDATNPLGMTPNFS